MESLINTMNLSGFEGLHLLNTGMESLGVNFPATILLKS